MRLFDSDGIEICDPEEIKRHMNDPEWREYVAKERERTISNLSYDKATMCVHGISGDLHDSENYCWQDDYIGCWGSDYSYS